MFTLNTLWIILALAVFAGLVVLLALGKRKWKLGFTVRVAAALAAGAAYGTALHFIFADSLSDGAGAETLRWVDVVGSGFTLILRLVIVPLVLVSIINALGKSANAKTGFKKSGKIIGILLTTTAASAVIAILVTRIFPLNVDNLVDWAEVQPPKSVPETLLSLIPSNLFAALSGGAVLPVVFVAALIGFAYAAVRKENPKAGKNFGAFLDTSYAFVMKIVEFIIELTPYGILAIIAGRAASGNWAMFAQLGLFVAACFTAIILVFAGHLGIMWGAGVRPDRYLKKTGAALMFAFSSRSSAATVPLTIKAQRALGVPEADADLAGTLGTCIGQNGCAGIYPTMLAILVAQLQGLNAWSAGFLIPLIIYVVIASIGTAGVGGGAFNVSLLVLSLAGLPIELAVVLMSVDFIVDMGRTALNVSDSILAGYITAKWDKEIKIPEEPPTGNTEKINKKSTVRK